MQDNQQSNNNSVNGLGTPPTSNDNNDSSTSYSDTPVNYSTNDIQNTNSNTPTINPNNNARSPLNSVSDISETSKSEALDTNNGKELLDLKKRALQQLQPLVDRLDLSPEEKFNTTMMMIQASDDQTLISKAFDAAQKISNEKDKAQALLDIVNEINYFTHNEEVM